MDAYQRQQLSQQQKSAYGHTDTQVFREEAQNR